MKVPHQPSGLSQDLPKAPETGPKDGDQINLTDEESRLLPSHDGFIQGYNSQAAVDGDTMLIVATTVTQQTSGRSSRC